MSAANHLRPITLLTLAIIAASTACAAPVDTSSESTASTQQAITNGEDDEEDPGVVALLLDGNVYCTGVLLTPNVVATAAHCVTPSPPDQVFFGSRPSTKKGTFVAVADARVHPEFDEDTLENDIAVVGLATKAPAAPVGLFMSELDGSSIGREIRIVGFGATGGDATSSLRKRSGTTSILSYTNDDFRFAPGPSQTCVGDSGGPAFATVNGKEAVLGLTSSGDGNCKTYGRDMRIDRYVPFIRNYAKAYKVLVESKAAPESKGCSAAPTAPSGGACSAALLVLLAVMGAARARRTVRA